MGAGVGMPWIKRTVAGAAERRHPRGRDGRVWYGTGLGRVRGDGDGVRSRGVWEVASMSGSFGTTLSYSAIRDGVSPEK